MGYVMQELISSKTKSLGLRYIDPIIWVRHTTPFQF